MVGGEDITLSLTDVLHSIGRDLEIEIAEYAVGEVGTFGGIGGGEDLVEFFLMDQLLQPGDEESGDKLPFPSADA